MSSHVTRAVGAVPSQGLPLDSLLLYAKDEESPVARVTIGSLTTTLEAGAKDATSDEESDQTSVADVRLPCLAHQPLSGMENIYLMSLPLFDDRSCLDYTPSQNLKVV